MRFLQSEARGVVYTCLTGNYDTLREHKYLNKNWDYVCFTDDEKLLAHWSMPKKTMRSTIVTIR